MAMDSGHRFRSLMLYHLSDHSEIDMADKGNHTDVTNGLGSANLIIVRVLVLNWKTTLIWELEDKTTYLNFRKERGLLTSKLIVKKR